jgi:hypothetical protein
VYAPRIALALLGLFLGAPAAVPAAFDVWSVRDAIRLAASEDYRFPFSASLLNLTSLLGPK